MNSCATPFEPPLAAEGGLDAPAHRDDGDPYRALDDLMAAVEILRPVWPARDTFVNGGKMLLCKDRILAEAASLACPSLVEAPGAR